MDTVVCLKWGEKYGPEYVNILHSMVERNLKVLHDFFCATDNTAGIKPNIKTLPLYDEITLPNINAQRGWWYKLAFFKERPWNLEGRILFLDLDLIIVDNIDCFFETSGNFTIIKEWHRQGYQSSVFTLDTGTLPQIWNDFNNNPAHSMSRFHGDQEWIFHHYKGANHYPDDWVKSYKYHCKNENQPPEGSKIISFHGRPNPHEAHTLFNKRGKYPPALWAPKFWRE